MDEPFYQSNLLLDSVETSTFAEYLLSSNDADMDFMAMTPQDTEVLGIWNSPDPNSGAFTLNQENPDETKMAHDRNTALSINSGSSPRIEERCSERTNVLSLENVGLNLNNTPVDDGQAFTQSPSPSNLNQSAEHGGNVEVSLCTSVPEFFEPERVPSSNSNADSSSGVVQVSEHYDRARNSVDAHRASLKRKNIEGVIGESSSSQKIAGDFSIPSSSKYLSAGCSSGENRIPSFNSIHGGDSSECYPLSSLTGNAESSQRNLRVRLNLQCQHDNSPYQSHSATSSNSLSSTWSAGEPSSVPNPFIHQAEQSQHHLLPVPGLHHHVRHSPASSRMGSSSIPAVIQRRMRLIASHEEANIRNFPRNGVADHPTFFARTSVNQLVQDPLNWNPSNSNLSTSENRVSTSSGIIPLPGSSREPSEMVPVQYPRNFSDVVRNSLFPSGGSESGHQSGTLSSWHSGCAASTQETGQSSRAVRQGQSLPHPRTAVSTDRQRGFSALPLPVRGREGRSRMLSEQIRNALDLMRRGVNLRFEDVFMFDQPGFYGRVDLNDRHRDMRLDVDNMSYEELLALEERIGYVNTGLCEQTILKCLKQRKYSPSKQEVASLEQEPCCICREDYSEGEDIGTLNCRHDFHTACIKQWLMIKNLCPICKTTALVDGHSTSSDGTK
ncbi:probable E3 ubiquitin-protein ligase HIP1 isoform X1 [Dendrobium catenatum]|uniref:probable E3 ubiquitin-protein ligase HIP1 isoform X1 n=1 Tax=Dendrobium catenatum TaxID=906689 RepID=UPI0009F41AA9|nr:probable E3 ubiquitin-protein ligase HIP1 isoform X1 [Dendrobium catenatum]XP_020672194.1 probable E3 ubiquitin-protein ligase HIP1 isoform X1 [Dendrobium catenatum]XP_020672195.1 probable E3 ubiquitin-protein ligase HIP1 isoform X1 [Dendrobium catenatum]XP_020672196.1 probable E3 ubiquitin-protein ligase HIP1 isoform X1 [Dendrobium catenatum]XP_028551499.1 probable E3 ubiquitin-protein ligase HIP1 isoform X1 [Dendrobium catenatum]